MAVHAPHASVHFMREVQTPGIPHFRLVDYLRGPGLVAKLTLDATDEEVAHHFCVADVSDVPARMVSVCKPHSVIDGGQLVEQIDLDHCIPVATLLQVVVCDPAVTRVGTMPLPTYTAFCVSLRDGAPRQVCVIPHRRVLYLSVFTKRNTRNARKLCAEDLILYGEAE